MQTVLHENHFFANSLFHFWELWLTLLGPCWRLFCRSCGPDGSQNCSKSDPKIGPKTNPKLDPNFSSSWTTFRPILGSKTGRCGRPCFQGFLEPHLNYILTPFWSHVGPILDPLCPSWPHLGASLPVLAPSWPVLASSWFHFGPIFVHLGLSWRPMAPSWPILAAKRGSECVQNGGYPWDPFFKVFRGGFRWLLLAPWWRQRKQQFMYTDSLP